MLEVDLVSSVPAEDIAGSQQRTEAVVLTLTAPSFTSAVVLPLTGVAVCLLSPEVDSNNVCIKKYLTKKVV